MQDTFLNYYPKLMQTEATAHPGLSLNGLWLAHGDEPLLHQWLIDAMRIQWRAQHLAIQRVDLVSVKSWHDVLGELNSLSLFNEATAVIITGNHKPDKYVQTELERFAMDVNVSGDNQNCVLWLTAKVDKRAQTSKWYTPFAKYGQVIDCNLYNENQRQQLLTIHARRFGLALTAEAWQFLMLQTEHHLLSAYQALWRLSYLLTPSLYTQAEVTSIASGSGAATSTTPTLPAEPTKPTQLTPVSVDVEALQQALVSAAQYSVFDLSDAMLAGDAAKVVRIIEQLRSTNEPMPLVLWALSKDMRLIMQLMDGQDAQSLGIWSSKQAVYQAACWRQSLQSIHDWPDIIYECDKAVKGVIRQPAWELILQAALRVAGLRLFA